MSEQKEKLSKEAILEIIVAIMLGVAVVAFLIATIFMFTIPMPTGFDFASYFR